MSSVERTTISIIAWNKITVALKQRSYPMRGFGNVASAARFCRAFDEVRQYFRVQTSVKQKVSLAQQREVFRQRLDLLKTLALVG